jgi:hypothetical protein
MGGNWVNLGGMLEKNLEQESWVRKKNDEVQSISMLDSLPFFQ